MADLAVAARPQALAARLMRLTAKQRALLQALAAAQAAEALLTQDEYWVLASNAVVRADRAGVRLTARGFELVQEMA